MAGDGLWVGGAVRCSLVVGWVKSSPLWGSAGVRGGHGDLETVGSYVVFGFGVDSSPKADDTVSERTLLIFVEPGHEGNGT